MSAPTPAPGDDRPREGYYPDPSIPGYVRYWNGASWVPGTSRPAPKDGEPLAPPPGARPSVEETGPHFFDEDPVEEPPPADASQHGSRPEPAASWAADRSGAAGAQGSSVAWPGPAQATDPRLAHAQGTGPTRDPRAQDAGAGPAGGSNTGSGSDAGSGSGSGSGTGSGTAPDAVAAAGSASDRGEAEAESGNTFVFRRPTAGPGARGAQPSDGAADEGTMTFRAVSPRAGATGGPGFAAGKAAAARAAAPTAPSGPQQTAGPAVPHQAAAPSPQQAAPSPQQQAPASQPQPAASAPVAAGPGGGQASWAQQVHRLAGAGEGEQPVAPWKPPVEDVFQAAARRQAAARPAGLGKRLAARLIDTVVLGAVTAVAAVPLGLKAVDHVNGKIDEAKLSGETVTVWLLDGTTSTYLGIVLAVLLVFGGLYEALPTAKWGRTLGKKLLGLEVRDIEAHEPPTLGAALRRWLVYSVPGLLAIGLVGVVWCVFDRPWRQCWHDKAANTFVAG
ncbi:RDD family protein [Streptomyces sp. AC602_WCS936]|uniref:RDD family protein n=1 Tax=Streptomyces sp. AC602_WCS936 TaxID=2823685 RepID=UPI001C2659FD|nr:RDD family protein [Streptomyces sp. AC602_WCS936]